MVSSLIERDFQFTLINSTSLNVNSLALLRGLTFPVRSPEKRLTIKMEIDIK